MPMQIPVSEQVVDSEDKNSEVSVTPNTTQNNILNFNTKNGYKAYISFLGMAWDSTFDTYLTWRLLVNDCAVYRFVDSKVQIAPPEQPSQELTPWLEVPQQANIKFQVDVATGPAGAANVAARIKVYYVPVETNL